MSLHFGAVDLRRIKWVDWNEKRWCFRTARASFCSGCRDQWKQSDVAKRFDASIRSL